MKTPKRLVKPAAVAGILLGLACQHPGVAANLLVPANYRTIQAAVDAAKTNDVIQISPGVYTEQVRILTNALTLIGQPGTILRATPSLAKPPGNVHYPILFVESSAVTVKGLTFEGERLAALFPGPGELQGILLRDSNARIETCDFYGFRASELDPVVGIGMRAIAERTDFVADVTVVGCRFTDSLGAIFFRGLPDRKSMSASLENNTVIGLGPLDNSWNTAGIQIGEGVAARIAGNTISGFSYIGTEAAFPISFGVLVAHQFNYPEFGVPEPVVIEGNTFRDNQIHVSLGKANGSIVRHNRFQGTAPGVLPEGLSVSGTNVVIANNLFQDVPEGIRLLGLHPLQDPLPDLGDILGFAVDAQVVSNRFCNVTTSVNLLRPATATETGTELGSCDTPPLRIQPAVLLSWPGADGGWTLESAARLDGPWAPPRKGLLIQAGREAVAVPHGAGQHFFRLR